MTVAARPAGRQRSVRCPDCGTPRTVSLEQAIRIAKGVHSPQCQLCRNPAKVREPGERERSWWLTQGGVPRRAITEAGGSVEYVRRHGLPASLEPIVASAAFLSP